MFIYIGYNAVEEYTYYSFVSNGGKEEEEADENELIVRQYTLRLSADWDTYRRHKGVMGVRRQRQRCWTLA